MNDCELSIKMSDEEIERIKKILTKDVKLVHYLLKINDNEEMDDTAKELIGQNVKISYGERVGFYSTSKCHQAPVEKIDKIERNEK